MFHVNRISIITGSLSNNKPSKSICIWQLNGGQFAFWLVHHLKIKLHRLFEMLWNYMNQPILPTFEQLQVYSCTVSISRCHGTCLYSSSKKTGDSVWLFEWQYLRSAIQMIFYLGILKSCRFDLLCLMLCFKPMWIYIFFLTWNIL